MSQIEEDDEYSLLANNQTVFVCPIQQATTYQVSLTLTPIPLHVLNIEIIQTEDMTMPIFLFYQLPQFHPSPLILL